MLAGGVQEQRGGQLLAGVQADKKGAHAYGRQGQGHGNAAEGRQRPLTKRARHLVELDRGLGYAHLLCTHRQRQVHDHIADDQQRSGLVQREQPLHRYIDQGQCHDDAGQRVGHPHRAFDKRRQATGKAYGQQGDGQGAQGGNQRGPAGPLHGVERGRAQHGPVNCRALTAQVADQAAGGDPQRHGQRSGGNGSTQHQPQWRSPAQAPAHGWPWGTLAGAHGSRPAAHQSVNHQNGNSAQRQHNGQRAGGFRFAQYGDALDNAGGQGLVVEHFNRAEFSQHVQGVDQKAGGDGVAQLRQGDAQKGGRRALAQRARGFFLGRVEPAQRSQRGQEYIRKQRQRHDDHRPAQAEYQPGSGEILIAERHPGVGADEGGHAQRQREQHRPQARQRQAGARNEHGHTDAQKASKQANANQQGNGVADQRPGAGRVELV